MNITHIERRVLHDPHDEMMRLREICDRQEAIIQALRTENDALRAPVPAGAIQITASKSGVSKTSD